MRRGLRVLWAPAPLIGLLLAQTALPSCGGSSSSSPAGPTPTPAPTPGPAPSCVSGISPTTASYDNSGGSGSLAITAPASCSWTSKTNVNWITGIATENNAWTGNAQLPYSVTTNNATSARTGTLTVGDKTLTVTQSGSAHLEIRGNYTFQVQAASSCNWPARTHSWPVRIRVDLYVEGVTNGAIIGFPQSGAPAPPEIRFQAEPTRTWLFPGTVNLASTNGYTVRIEENGGAGAPTRAADGRGEIRQGELGKMVLTHSVNGIWDGEWECFLGNTWSLRTR